MTCFGLKNSSPMGYSSVSPLSRGELKRGFEPFCGCCHCERSEAIRSFLFAGTHSLCPQANFRCRIIVRHDGIVLSQILLLCKRLYQLHFCQLFKISCIKMHATCLPAVGQVWLNIQFYRLNIQNEK